MRKPGLPSYTKSSSAGSRVSSRAKSVANSRAAKDVKKVVKVAGPGVAAGLAVKKANDNTKKDIQKMDRLRKQYDKSAAKGSMTFNDYVKKYGNK